ncbi:MAG: hypothetical protein ACXWC2_07140 [Ramlibacter sp.]
MSGDLRDYAQARGCTPDQFLRGFACRNATAATTAQAASRQPQPTTANAPLRVDAQRAGVAVSIDIGSWTPHR